MSIVLKFLGCAATTLLIFTTLTGCGGPTAKITGRVTCQGKAVAGEIQFTPNGDNPTNTGPAINANLNADGRYTLILKSVGPHRILITASDASPEKAYPCNLSALEREVKAGDNEIILELPLRE